MQEVMSVGNVFADLHAEREERLLNRQVILSKRVGHPTKINTKICH